MTPSDLTALVTRKVVIERVSERELWQELRLKNHDALKALVFHRAASRNGLVLESCRFVSERWDEDRKCLVIEIDGEVAS